jgi:hypothetical protein
MISRSVGKNSIFLDLARFNIPTRLFIPNGVDPRQAKNGIVMTQPVENSAEVVAYRAF